MDKLNNKALTLLELLIAMAISGLIMSAVYKTFNFQQKNYASQENVADMQQNIRAAMLFMINDIRMAGYDPMLTNNFGITDIRPRDINNKIQSSIKGYSSIELTKDRNEDGILDSNERILYSVYDYIKTDDNLDMAKKTGGGGRSLFAENIKGFGLGFAFDDDLDGDLDTYTSNSQNYIIWAIDSDADNDLDTNLDTNKDGVIDINDALKNQDANTMIEGIALNKDVDITKIRAVQIWILASTDNPLHKLSNTKYVVGRYIITSDSNKKMRLSNQIVNCRNINDN